jgi:hypothetical protein
MLAGFRLNIMPSAGAIKLGEKITAFSGLDLEEPAGSRRHGREAQASALGELGEGAGVPDPWSPPLL